MAEQSVTFADIMRLSGEDPESFRAKFQEQEDLKREELMRNPAMAYYMLSPLPKHLRPTAKMVLDAYACTDAEVQAWSRNSQADRDVWLASRAAMVPHTALAKHIDKQLEHITFPDEKIEATHRALAQWRENEVAKIKAGGLHEMPEAWHVGIAAKGSGSRAVHWASVEGAYETQEGAMTELLWPSFAGNRFTEWGKDNEPKAEKWMFEQLVKMWTEAAEAGHPNPVVRAWLENRGFQTTKGAPYLGCSVDGILYVQFRDGSKLRYVVEYKCPASVRRETGKRHVYDHLYVGYVVQAIFNCAITEVDGDPTPMANVMLFCVYTPDEQQIQFIHWRDHDNPNTIVSRMTSYFFDHYMPLLLMRESRMLVPGTLWLKKSATADEHGKEECPATADDHRGVVPS